MLKFLEIGLELKLRFPYFGFLYWARERSILSSGAQLGLQNHISASEIMKAA